MPNIVMELRKGPKHYTALEEPLAPIVKERGFEKFGIQTIQRAGTRLVQMGLMSKKRGTWELTTKGEDHNLTEAEAIAFVQAKNRAERK